MKRIIMAMFLILSLISSAALSYAEEGIPGGAGEKGSSTDVSITKVKDDPLFGEIKAKYEALKVLRTEQGKLMAEIKAMTEANKALEEQLRNGLKRDKSQVQTTVKEQFANQVAELKALIEERKNLLDQLKALRLEAPARTEKPERLNKPVDGGTNEPVITPEAIPQGAVKSPEMTALKEQIDALTVQIKEKAQALQLAKEAAASGKDAANPLAQQMKAAHEEIKALRGELDKIRIAIEQLQVEKNQEWGLFKADMEAKDLTAASAHMSRILELKQQIIDQLKDVLKIKEEINSILKELVDGLPKSDGQTVKPEELKAPAPDFLPGELETPVV